MDKYSIKLKTLSGQSLIEVIVALAIGGILIGTAAGAIALILKNNLTTRTTQIAVSLNQELMDTVQVIAESDWHKIYNLSKGASSHYYISSSTRETVSGDELLSIENRIFIRYFYIENVNRDFCGVGSIVAESATSCGVWPGGSDDILEDPSSQKITVLTSWQTGRTASQSQYLTRHRNLIFKQSDWSGGPGQEGPITSENNRFAISSGTDFTSIPGAIKIQLP